MAAVGNDSKFWGQGSSVVQDDIDYPRYISSLTCPQITGRALTILGTTALGAGLGAGVGAAAGGIGAGPGAGIGAGIGFGIGLMTVSVYDYSDYKQYRASITEDARLSLDEIMNSYANGPDCICAITHCVPLVPVRIKGEKQIYEKAALEQVLDQQGCSPMTRKVFGLVDIEFCTEGVTQTGKICDKILNDPQERTKYSADQILGIKILRKECLKVAQDYFEKETASLMKKARSKMMNPRELASMTMKLAEVLDPILSREAEINRDEDRKENV